MAVTQRVVFGVLETIQARLAEPGWQINTALVERLNLNFRHHLAVLGRRVRGYAKTEAGLLRQLYLWQAYYNFCLPHASLRQPWPVPIPTKGTGSAKKWQLYTPAMTAQLTDHIWTVRELLLLRVPPWPQAMAI